MTNTAEVITVDPNHEMSDEFLVEQIVAGDKEQFRLLYERHARKVWRFAFRMTGNVEAEDLTSEIFLQVYRKLETFKGDSRFSTWLHSVMVRTTTNFVSRHRNQSFRGKQEPLLHVITKPSQEDPEGMASRKEIHAHVHRAMLSLKPKPRAMIALHSEGFSYAEIAKLLQCEEGTVGSTLTRARNKLARKLKRLKGLSE